MQRVQVFQLVQVPDQLDNATCKYDRTTLFRGFLVCRYTNSGTLLIVQVSQKTSHTVPNPSPITAVAFSYPLVITLHASDILQVYNVDSKQCDQYQQEKDVVAGIRSIVTDSRSIVGIAPKRIVAWDRENILFQPPKIFETTAATASISSISDRSCLLTGPHSNKVLVANANPGGQMFQVWDFVKGDLVCYGDNPSKSESFLTLDAHDGKIVASCRDSLYIFSLDVDDLEPGKPTTGLIPPRIVPIGNCVVTAVHIDSHFLLVGDNFGNISLHTTSGRLLYHLTRDRRAPSDVDMKDVDLGQLTLLFRSRVNRVTRVGRWVLAALENSRAEVYDLFTPMLSTACDSYVHPTPAPIRDFAVHDQKVCALVSASKPAADSSSGRVSTGGAGSSSQSKPKGKPDLVVWSPKTEADGFDATTLEAVEKWVGSVADMLSGQCSRIVDLVRKIEGLRPDDIKANQQAFQDLSQYLTEIGALEQAQKIRLPFLLYQNLVQSLDSFETYLVKLAKGMRTAKTKEHLEELRLSVLRAKDFLSSCSDFLGEVKAKNQTVGSLVPFSEKAGGGEAAVVDEKGGHSTFGAMKRKNLRKALERKGTKRADGGEGASGEGSAEQEEEDMVDEMLGDVVEELGSMHEQTNDIIERYDTVCNEECSTQTPKVSPAFSPL